MSFEVLSSNPPPTTTTPRDRDRPTLSRPLSEISENESNRRVSASNRSSVHSISKKSRPASEAAKEDSTGAGAGANGVPSSATTKRLSASMPLQTITVNLVDYAKSQPQAQSQAQTQTQARIHSPSQSAAASTSASTSTSTPRPVLNVSSADNTHLFGSDDAEVTIDRAPPPPSPSSKSAPPELPRRPGAGTGAGAGEQGRTVSMSSTSSKKSRHKKDEGVDGADMASPAESSRSGVSSYLLAKRASLRPSSLSISYAEVAKPIESPPATGASISATAFDSLESLPSASVPLAGDINASAKPATKSKPSWLRRASGTAALRSKSRTPPPKEEGSMTASTSLPPALPPRKGLESTIDEVPTSRSLPEEGMAPPPFPPRKHSNSYANIIAGPSRSRLGEGQGRPAFSPSGSSSGFVQPPPLPSRDNVGNIRGRIAAWTAAAQTSGSFNRSESSQSLASQAGSSTSHTQRFPNSAQRVLGHAGSAVQKGWAGLRARGVGGSISSMSSLGQSQSSKPRGFETSPSWSSGLSSRGTRDRTQSDHREFGAGGYAQGLEGPVFDETNVKRVAVGGVGRVFGRDIVEAGKEWGIADAGVDTEGKPQWEARRRKCLPAVVVRCVEYLEIWGPKEEGIFRISGRSSHIAKLRKEFDAGADIDLAQCHPGDLDPHAVAGLFKSYLRELPSPLLTHHLTPRFDAYVKGKGKATNNRATFDSTMAEDGHHGEAEDLKSLLQQLPQAHWFLLADIVKLLDLIPRHVAANRMTQNALMLSLGPSLNISGGVLNELIESKDTLFASPPAPSIIEDAEDLIDFGDVSIEPVAPPSLPQTQSSTRPTTPASQLTDESLAPAVIGGSAKSKRAPRLPAKPSLTKIFGSSMTSIPRQKSVDTLNSIVNIEPPRVDIPIGNNTPLPTFEATQPDSSEHGDTGNTPTPKAALLSISVAADVPIPETPLASGAEKLDEVHYPAGTVGERSRIFSNSNPSVTATSTPIADRFQGTSSPFPALRGTRSSNGSLSGQSVSTASDGNPTKTTGEGSPNPGTNPATVIRRGQPVFFQSAGVGVERHTHGHTRASSHSANSALNSPNLSQGSPSFNSPNPNGNGNSDGQFGDVTTAGQKRKDEGERERHGDVDGNGEGNRAKRLSAGPATLGGSEVDV
ncbi:hypothetical protein I317_02787 [Kwoniella heveanensis CBS 569]|nr:hypothetical protein I317_02787 [Kwoniella heveanensis CBS 569]